MYVSILVALTEAVLVVYQAHTGVLAAARLVFGLGLLGFLPGFATSEAIFPGDRLSGLERTLMSIFLSVAISIALGVALGAVYRFTDTSSVLLSTLYIVGATLAGGFRRYSWLKQHH